MDEPQPDTITRQAQQQPVLVERDDGLKHPSPTYARAFLGLVRAGETLERRLNSELRAKHGLSLRGFEVLLHLAAFSPAGRLRMSHLAAQAPLSQSRVSRLVAELDARGLVARATSEGDSRCVMVTITDDGLDQLREAQDTHLEGLRRWLFSRLTWEQITQLADITDRLLAGEEP